MIRLVVGKYYNAPNDDLIITPAIVYGDAKYNDLMAKAIALVWLRWSVGISWINRREYVKFGRNKFG